MGVYRKMSRPRFCLYIFGPISLCYFLPFILYQSPLKVLTAEGPYEIQSINLILAFIASIVWFGIAISLISYPNLLPNKKTYVRYWTENARFSGFLWFSIFGCFVAIVHLLFRMPAAIEQFVHQLSLMPTIGLILGICCLEDLRGKGDHILKKTLVFCLLGLNALVVFALPIIFGIIGVVATSAVAILFGMAVIGVRTITQILVLSIFTMIIFGGLGIKTEIRQLMCSDKGGACSRVAIEMIFQEDEKLNLVEKHDYPQDSNLSNTDEVPENFESQKRGLVKKSAFPQETKKSSTHKLLKMLGSPKDQAGQKKDLLENRILPTKDELLKSLESGKKIFESGHDPNFKNIRFMPSQLNGSIFHYFIARVLHRMNHLGELSYVIQATGDSIPYANGQTYTPLLTKFIPRVIWPGKPQETFGQYFGHRYRLIHDHDFETAVNLPLIVEGYVNWGWLGIVFSAMFVGAVLRLLWEFWIGESPATGNVVLGMVIVSTLVLQEGNLSLLCGGVLYGGLVYWSLEALFRYCFTTKFAVGRSLGRSR